MYLDRLPDLSTLTYLKEFRHIGTRIPKPSTSGGLEVRASVRSLDTVRRAS